VVLYVSSDRVDTDFTVKLIDEYPPSFDFPSGFAMNITHGIIRCRFRNVASPKHRQPELMEPGKVYRVEILLYPTSNLFQRGHMVRLDISSSNFPHFDVNLNTGEEYGESQRYLVAENSVFHSDFYPSRIILPVQANSTVSKQTQTQADFTIPLLYN
jgi:putative CocE/NonD family hydrolase